MTTEQLLQAQNAWQALAAESLTKAFDALDKELPLGTPKRNVLLALRGRLNDTNLDRIRGVLSQADLELAYNRIRTDLLTLISELTPADFIPGPESPAVPRAKTGVLLHKIPNHMQVDREEACIIRLAFDREAIIRDLDLDEEVVLKDITVSEIMHVELIDPAEEPAFQIRSFSDTEQFLQTADYSEWLFFVKPIRAGVFNLMLKVSVVEVIAGKERKRNISLEERIEITAEASAENPVEFRQSGITLVGGGIAEFPAIPLPGAPSPAPQSPVPSPAPHLPAKTRRIPILRNLSIAASILLVASVAVVTLMDRKDSPIHTTPNPITPAPKDDEQLITPDSLAWVEAIKQNTPAAYRHYLDLFPQGKYAPEARQRLE